MMKAKTKITWIWSILPVLVMLVGLLSTTALAAGSQTADFTSGDGSAALALLNAAKTEGAENSTWVGNTLTLNGVDFTTTAATAVKLPDGAKIVLADGTTNTIKGGDSSSGECYGIYVETGNLTIQGPGTLTVTGGKSTAPSGYGHDYSHGIYVNGNVTIEGANVEATGSDTRNSFGIWANGGDVAINGGTVTAKSGDGTYSYGIDAGKNVTISGGTVTAKSGDGTYSYGIAAGKNVTINGGADVTAKGGTANGEDGKSHGIKAGTNVTINGGADVNANGGTVTGEDGDSHGIKAGTNVTINGGADVNANGGTANGKDGESHGIYADTNVEISGGTVTATGGNATNSYGESHGIYTGNSVNISGGIVTATGGKANGQGGDSYGIYTGNSVNISGGGIVTATGGKALRDSYGIFSSYYGSVNITGGAVKAEADDESGTASALNKQPTLPITGYSWRTSDSEEYREPGYIWQDNPPFHTYVEIKSNPTVTFDVNGANASVAPASGTTNAAGKLTSLPTPTRSGYTFKEWNTKQDGSGTKVDENYVFSANTTVYAQWTAATYTVTFNANGENASVTPASSTTNAAGKLTSLPTPTLEGYTFNGWYTAASGGTKVDENYVFSANTTVYAQWTAATYTVTFNANGENASVTPASSTTNAASKLTSLPKPTRSGYTFKEWNTKQDGSGTKVTTSTIFNADTTVYAQWAAATYTVTWKSQDGSGTLETDEGVTSGTAPNFDKAPPTKADDDQYTYTFAGWATSKNQESGKVVSSLPNVTDNVTYYAAFSKTARSYSVTLNTNGGTINSGNVTTYTYGTGATLPTPTKTGYTFGGWYDSSSFTGDAVTAIASNATGAKTFYAKWNVISTGSSSGGSSYTPPTYKVESTVSKDDDGSVSVSKSNAKKGDTVTITVTPDRYYKVDGVTVKDKNGKEIAVTDNGDGTFTFKMPDSKVDVEPVFSWDNPFGDVTENAYYAPAVEWALKNEVTGGTTTATFSPNTGCTRAQIVTFLWRAANCPEPTGTQKFDDVVAGSYYEKAIAWAVENGITDGTGNGLFSPDAICTRAQAVTFLFRSKGITASSSDIEFEDVAPDAYYADAVAWALEMGITNGVESNLFAPNNTCTRAQIITFLYRNNVNGK